MASQPIVWPDGKSFAFTVFDDTDSQSLEASRLVYGLLEDYGFRTTRSVWPTRGPRHSPQDGATCADPEFLEWAQQLQSKGFEIGYHMAASHTSNRQETIAALDAFARHFGGPPATMANHYNSVEDIYWGEARLSGWRRGLYRLFNRLTGRNDRFYGHVADHPFFWADVCQNRIKYVRNFIFGDINTLAACPWMPYHDPDRPFVNYWFAGSEGANVNSYLQRISEANQDRLEAENGACIMYTHYGLGFVEHGEIDSRFRRLMERLSRKNGWFPTVVTLLDYVLEQRGRNVLSSAQRRELEWSWMTHKIRFGPD